MTKLTELKALAEKHTNTEHGKRAGLYAEYMRLASPSTILALIEVWEAAEAVLPVIGDRALHGPEHNRLRAALEGVKK